MHVKFLRSQQGSVLLATKDAATGDPEPRDSMSADDWRSGICFVLVRIVTMQDSIIESKIINYILFMVFC